MANRVNRRNFLKAASVASVFGATWPAAGTTAMLKVSLNAYSFNKLLNDAIRKRGPGITLLDLVDFCAKNKFDGFDPTAYFMPGYPAVPPNDYVDTLRKKCG